MPSKRHEGLVDLFRNNPRLTTLGLGKLASKRKAVLADSSVTTSEFHPDLVVVLRNRTKIELALAVEIQLWRDLRKLWTWPVVATGLRAKYRCPAELLVIAPSVGVRSWAERSIVIDANGSVCRPRVLQPGDVPRIDDVKSAGDAIELSVLSAVCHRTTSQALPAVVAAGALDERRADMYIHTILTFLLKPERERLERLMQSNAYPWSDFARRHYSKGLTDGKLEGKLEGKSKENSKESSRHNTRPCSSFWPSAGSKSRKRSAPSCLHVPTPSESKGGFARRSRSRERMSS